MVKQFNKEQALVVSSFYHENLLAFREACPKVKTAASGQEAQRYIIASKVGLGWLFKPNAQVLQLPMASGSITVLTAMNMVTGWMPGPLMKKQTWKNLWTWA